MNRRHRRLKRKKRSRSFHEEQYKQEPGVWSDSIGVKLIDRFSFSMDIGDGKRQTTVYQCWDNELVPVPVSHSVCLKKELDSDHPAQQ